MKSILLTSIKYIAALYSIGYIIFGYPNDTFLMRALNSLMFIIFSVTVLMAFGKYIKKKLD